MTHDEIEVELQTSVELYGESYKALNKTWNSLQTDQKKLPVKFSQEHEKYEDHLLFSAGLKHQAIELWKKSLAVWDAIKSDYDHLSAHMKIYTADSFFAERGFQRITDSLRDEYVNASDTLNKLKKIKGDLAALALTSEKLVRAFESDETNCRRLLERQSKLIGIQ